MVFTRQSLLILLALFLSGARLFAVGHEDRDFTAANAAFQDSMWGRAETEFGQFIQKYPKSAHVSEALLMQAQADFKQGRYPQTIALLKAGAPSAGNLADQYAYWIGQAQFQSTEYYDAIATYTQLASTYTTSPWRLDAVVNQAATYAKLGQWAQVNALLQKSDIFQNAARTNASDARVLNGRLLLAESLLQQNHPGPAAAVLESATVFQSNPGLDWTRLYLLCRAQLADGNTNDALALTTNLVAAAQRANSVDLTAKSIAERASILENIGQLSDAVSAYEENLVNNAPGGSLPQAVLKIADLSAAQHDFSGAENSLANFQSRFPASANADLVQLTLGELHLKSYVAQPSVANPDLHLAHGCFDQFIDTFTNSPFLGNAYLDRGWCFWIEQNWPESAADFQSAVDLLPPSTNQAVARFKLGDAAFRLNDLTNALVNYRTVLTDYTNFPVVQETFGAEALYQSLLISLQLQDFHGASNDLSQILKIYPVSRVTEPSILLVGQAMSDLREPVQARTLFQKFEQEFSNSGQLPEVELAIARTYEQENNWPQAIDIYDSWIHRFPNNNKYSAVKYARAWANFQGGNETNAFLLFTNFLAEFPSNAVLTPIAQWWLGDYYYGRGQWDKAEENYEYVYNNWPASKLAYPAMLMAGRSAIGRQGYQDAKDYLIKLIGDTNCPPDLDASALFAYGDVLMQQPSPDSNTPLTNYWQAIGYFQIICQQYPGTVQQSLAYGEIGNCYLQLGSQASHFYADATNAYAQVMASPYAEIDARSQAQVGIGIVLERLAALNSTNQTVLLQSALDNYLDVFFKKNLRDGETFSPQWVNEAGTRALPLIETLGVGKPDQFIDQMEALFPQKRDLLEKKRLEIPRPKNL